ncbi:CMGC/SRPK protein kinase [Trichophyton rubrum D6]|uniref:non-specific serine/threonine protein kinase n=2 Tax=Trichophyton TaxID=5550 RepID=A0A022WGA6_TRIRU|nr:CMGC/SRPK protein kinase [Trichophyton rubrum MR850]EZF46699.1 CMGC/SRPK protein kinase [Trichophyton rubrum CBS 100081]EZF57364.1 CMGC/SRPK protein kinase [Trichophyton rubrum CBS 288.86]EZF67940.1 CMGC/SRPK protein kinase [Trichophyton rubrum CBS 289.86]EZF78675.1 CMGC/SRPK protein kinase [Trichophyton soudanense CBS 452.61]EZF89299.1 CMGC/SRPK protein kinase [Trichophyton rubrum MR1448]EZG11029.1 CMGC/SRPK protein kinase [Trichophyton rubrum CBS 735.88]EZG21689.1 CMGC/SRPK protein kina
MSFLRRMASQPRRTMFSIKKSPWEIPSNQGPSLPQHELVDEEICPGYNPASFYPAKPGEVLIKKFQLLNKIGWGSQSTVWLARNISRNKWQPEQFVAVKITNNNNTEETQHEKEIEYHIAHLNPEHRGHLILRTCLDAFDLIGPKGKHMCLVYEPMREPLWIFRKRFISRQIPLPIAKTYIFFLLVGLDYLHSECKIVHTDLKLDNILMSFESDEILTSFVKKKLQMGYGTNKLSSYPIQPDYYRTPEVILGCGWDEKADIWNFGVLLWNILGGKELFQQVHAPDGLYDAKSHLAEMIALLGAPPTALIARSKAVSGNIWPQHVTSKTGKLCNNPQEFFGGPFFGSEGEFYHNELVPSRKLESTVPFLEERERDAFLSFASQMLSWNPDQRKTARELIDHPFLKLGD